jgi:hypothetical protein
LFLVWDCKKGKKGKKRRGKRKKNIKPLNLLKKGKNSFFCVCWMFETNFSDSLSSCLLSEEEEEEEKKEADTE